MYYSLLAASLPNPRGSATQQVHRPLVAALRTCRIARKGHGLLGGRPGPQGPRIRSQAVKRPSLFSFTYKRAGSAENGVGDETDASGYIPTGRPVWPTMRAARGRASGAVQGLVGALIFVCAIVVSVPCPNVGGPYPLATCGRARATLRTGLVRRASLRRPRGRVGRDPSVVQSHLNVTSNGKDCPTRARPAAATRGSKTMPCTYPASGKVSAFE